MDITVIKERLLTPDRPLYEILIKTIREEIESGSWAPGAKLPADKELACELGISHITLAKALNELRRLGLLNRRRAWGTFVNGSPAQQKVKTPSRKIAVVFDSADEKTFQKNFFLSLYRNLENANCNMAFYSANNDSERQLELLKEIIRDPSLEGCIVWSILTREQAEELLKNKPKNYPLILMDKYYPGLAHDSVVFANVEGAQKLAKALLKKDIRHFVWLQNKANLEISSVKDRYSTIREMLREKELEFITEIDEFDPKWLEKGKCALILASSACLHTKEELEKFAILKEKAGSLLEIGVFEVDGDFTPDIKKCSCNFRSGAMAEMAVNTLMARLNGDDSSAINCVCE